MLSGTTTLLSEQKITSPLGTRERNTTATLRQRLTWQTLDHKPLLSEKENNCHTHTHTIWHNQRQKRVIICGLPFHSAAHFPLSTPHPPPQRFYIGAIHLPRGKRGSWEKKAFLKYVLLFNNIKKCNSFHMCVSVNLRLCYSILKLDQSCLHKEISGLRNADSVLLLWKAHAYFAN